MLSLTRRNNLAPPSEPGMQCGFLSSNAFTIPVGT